MPAHRNRRSSIAGRTMEKVLGTTKLYRAIGKDEVADRRSRSKGGENTAAMVDHGELIRVRGETEV
jgi:hypothetical protein